MQGSTTDSVKAIEGIITTITDIREIANGISTAISQQNAAIVEVAKNVTEAAAGTASVQSDITTVSGAAQKTKDESVDVLKASNAIGTRTTELNTALADFVVNLRKVI